MRPRALGAFQSDELKNINVLTTHLHRAIRLHIDLRSATMEAAKLSASLEALQEGVLICNSASRVMQMNSVAEKMLKSCKGINISGGILKARDGNKSIKALTKSIWNATQPYDRQSTRNFSAITLATLDRFPIIARIYPLPEEMRIDRHSHNGIALVILRNPNQLPQHDLSALSSVGFTQSKIALTQALSSGRQDPFRTCN